MYPSRSVDQSDGTFILKDWKRLCDVFGTFPVLKSTGDRSTPSSTTSLGGPREPVSLVMVGIRSRLEANYTYIQVPAQNAFVNGAIEG